MPPEKSKQLQMELVEWIDSMGVGGWHTASDYVESAQASMSCWSAGIVFQEDKTRLSLTLSTNHESHNSSITIPKCAIVKRTALGPRHGGKKRRSGR